MYDSPKWITNDEQGHILLVCIVEDLITLSLNHVAICDDDRFFIERFLGV